MSAVSDHCPRLLTLARSVEKLRAVLPSLGTCRMLVHSLSPDYSIRVDGGQSSTWLHHTVKPLPNNRNISTQPIYRKNVGCNMLRARFHHVATCCRFFGGLSLKMVKFEPATDPINTTRHNRVAKRTQRVVCCSPRCCFEMLRSFGLGWRRPNADEELTLTKG